jgi:hypothetical protein
MSEYIFTLIHKLFIAPWEKLLPNEKLVPASLTKQAIIDCADVLCKHKMIRLIPGWCK